MSVEFDKAILDNGVNHVVATQPRSKKKFQLSSTKNPDYTPLGHVQSISGYSNTRAPMDNYPTPDIATLSLLEREDFAGQIWEPACGLGNIAKHFKNCMATDIRQDNIYGETGIDFLTDSAKILSENPLHSGGGWIAGTLPSVLVVG